MQCAKAVTWRKRLWEKQGKGRRQGLLAWQTVHARQHLSICNLRLYLDPSPIRLHPHVFHPAIVDMKCSIKIIKMSAIRGLDRTSSSTDTESCKKLRLGKQDASTKEGGKGPALLFPNRTRPKAPSPGSAAMPASCVPCPGFGASARSLKPAALKPKGNLDGTSDIPEEPEKPQKPFFDMRDMAKPSRDLNLYIPSKSGCNRQNYALIGGDDTAGI